MSRRFGRNQRRAARATIADLEMRLAAAQREAAHARTAAHMARMREHDAVATAATRLMNDKPALDAAMRELAHSVGHTLGKELVPHAERLMQGMTPEFRGVCSYGPDRIETVVVEFRIPTVLHRYAIALSPHGMRP